MVEGNLEEVDSIDDESIYEELGLVRARESEPTTALARPRARASRACTSACPHACTNAQRSGARHREQGRGQSAQGSPLTTERSMRCSRSTGARARSSLHKRIDNLTAWSYASLGERAREHEVADIGRGGSVARLCRRWHQSGHQSWPWRASVRNAAFVLSSGCGVAAACV
eukprot:6188959-Pleurochrysis_carterae.AAC.2